MIFDKAKKQIIPRARGLAKKVPGWIFPARCAICDDVVTESELICRDCASKVRTIVGETCYKCGKKLRDSNKLYCYDCSKKIHYFDRGFSVFEYPDVKHSLYRFKYAGRAEYARFYARYAYDEIGNTICQLGVDALIPVPIHKKRYRKRGYNQAELFASEFSKLTNIPVINDYIIRNKSTIPLKLLDEKGRINNLKKAFIIGSNGVKLETIVIIDDIYTTGSTIDAISRVCRQAGVKKIYCLTVAVGKGL